MSGAPPQQGYPLAPAQGMPQGQVYANPMDPNQMAGGQMGTGMAAMQGGYSPGQYQASPYQTQPQYQQPGGMPPGTSMDGGQLASGIGQGGYAPGQYQAQPSMQSPPGVGAMPSQQGSGMMPIAATPQMVPGGYNSGAAYGFRGAEGAGPAGMPKVELDVALVKQVVTPEGKRGAEDLQRGGHAWMNTYASRCCRGPA